jgi:hypothetical protein
MLVLYAISFKGLTDFTFDRQQETTGTIEAE